MPGRDWTIMVRSVAVLGLLLAGFPFLDARDFVDTVRGAFSTRRRASGRASPKPASIGCLLKIGQTWLINSLVVAAGTTILSLAVALFPAYALSRFRFRGRGLVGLALFATQMLPEAMLVVPLYAIFGQLHLLDTLAGLVLANTAFTVPVVAWLLKAAVDGIPIEIEEAAHIDGCTQFDIVWRIILPLIAPSLAAASVIAFFHGWNEYVFAQTLVSSESLRTASVGLAGFVGELSTPIHTVMSIGIIYTLPAVIFYLFVQRYVVAGMTAGGVKG